MSWNDLKSKAVIGKRSSLPPPPGPDEASNNLSAPETAPRAEERPPEPPKPAPAPIVPKAEKAAATPAERYEAARKGFPAVPVRKMRTTFLAQVAFYMDPAMIVELDERARALHLSRGAYAKMMLERAMRENLDGRKV